MLRRSVFAVCLSIVPLLGACSSSNAHAPSGTGATAGAGATPLLMVVGDHFPAADSTGICADTQLRLTFTVPVAVGQSGKLQVWKVGDPGVPVDSIDLGASLFEDIIGGRHFFQNRPVFVEGMQATVYLHRKTKLAPNETYYVTVESGVFTDTTGVSLGEITSDTDWRFTTRAPAPASPDNLVVALDNTGDFCSVQGAIDAIPPANASPVTVTLKNGTYHEIVFIDTKHQITLHGEDRKSTIIAYANNNMLQTQAGGTGGTGNRAMIEVEKSNDLIIENLTLHNLTPQGGGQAEAIRIEPGDRAIIRDADLISLQDTVLISGRA